MMLLSMFCLVAAMAFAALTVDIGLLGLTRTDIQKAVDAAALAAALELGEAINEAAELELPPSEAIALAESNARDVAEDVANLNGVFVDGQVDVTFGKRIWNAAAGEFQILWGQEPPSVVKVTARRTNPDTAAPDGQLPLFFSPVGGNNSTSMVTSAVAFIDARDFVVVLDFSGSMNYDTGFKHYQDPFSKSDIEANLDDCWDALRDYNPRFSNTNRTKWRSPGFGRINSDKGRYVRSTNVNTVFHELRLDRLRPNGKPRFSFPQEGKNGIGGSMKGEPSVAASEARWKDYIEWVLDENDVEDADYRKWYGYRTLIAYLLSERREDHYSEDLWAIPHYPFHACKDGSPNYTTSNRHKQYALYQTKLCIDEGYIVHAMSVGADADGALMEAIAKSSGGVWVNAPGGSTIEDLRDQLLVSFGKIAAAVPAARLTSPD